MPPLPNTFDQETRDLVASAERRQKDLIEFQIPRLAKCNGPLPLQQSLSAELREDVETLARIIQSLELLIGDQKGQKNRRDLEQITTDLKQSLATIRKDTRNALLTSKRLIDSSSKSNRDELLQSSVLNEKQEKPARSGEDALMKANDDVTEALRRTVNLMQGELEKSVLSVQMLDSSSASLRATSSTHDTLTNLMDTSKMLITALEKSDWLDRILIFAALFFFFVVVLFILKQRILDRSIRIAFWWTRFIPDFSGESALVKMERSRSLSSTSTGTQVVSTLASTALTSLATAATLSSSSSASLSASSSIDTSMTTISSVVPSSDEQLLSPSPSTDTSTIVSPVVPSPDAHEEL